MMIIEYINNIVILQVCDGVADCLNGQDELDCEDVLLVDVVLEKDEAVLVEVEYDYEEEVDAVDFTGDGVVVEVEYDYEEEVDAVDYTGGGVVVEADVDLEEKVEEEIVVEQTEVVEETVVVENNDQKYLEMLESLANLSNTILDLNLTIVEWTMRL